MKEPLNRITDSRGWLAVLFQKELAQGQVYVFSILPDQVRGSHYHVRKTETFCVIQGQVELVLKYEDHLERVVLDAAQCIESVFVPAGCRHTFRNVGEGEALVVAFISERFNPADSDTFYDNA